MINSRYKEILLNYLKLCLNNGKNYLGIFCALNRAENYRGVASPICDRCVMKADCNLNWNGRYLCLR